MPEQAEEVVLRVSVLALRDEGQVLLPTGRRQRDHVSGRDAGLVRPL